MEKVQTRTNSDSIKEFNTLREALDFAKESNEAVVKKLISDHTPTDEELRRLVCKISMMLPNGERFDLVFLNGNWVLMDWGTEAAKLLSDLAEGAKFKNFKVLNQ